MAVVNYVTAVDRVLSVFSVATRDDLTTLVVNVSQRSMLRPLAERRIVSVIERRRILLGILARMRVPTAFADVHRTLTRSVVLSIADDRAIRPWIESSLAGDRAGATRSWAAQLVISERATHAKTAFLRNYNRLRGRWLGLRPLRVRY